MEQGEIIGINFTSRPADVEALEKLRRKHRMKMWETHLDTRVRLQGVTNTDRACRLMQVQATNGHRKIKVVGKHNYYWIYCS